MNLPIISSYGDYDSDNYGVNSLKVSFEEFDLYYSYKTIIAYCDANDGFVMCKNDWNTTTGKHMNWLDDDHSKRLPSQEFEQNFRLC